MIRRTSNLIFLIPLLLLTILIVGIVYLNLDSIIQGRIKATNLNGPFYSEELARIYKTETPKLGKMFNEKGVEETMAYFREEYKNYDEEAIHILEHFVGKELYLRNGLPGLSLCPTSSRYGCFHGFFVEAFSKEGRSFLKRAEDTCQFISDFLRASACMHGLGHGFLSLEGNSNIFAALKDCDSLTFPIPFGQEMCYTGVFMDYNEPRQLISREDKSALFRPCNTIPENYQPSCYLQLPQWWGVVMKNDFLKMGNLCREVSNSKNQESCFRGIGVVITRETRAEYPRIGALCSKMPKTGIPFCLEESAKLLSVLNKPEPLSPCGYLDSSAKNMCISNIKNFMCHNLLICN